MEMPSDILHAHFPQLVVVSDCDNAVLQSADIRNDGWSEPTRGVIVELVLVKVYLVSNLEIQVLSGHRCPCVHGAAQSCRC